MKLRCCDCDKEYEVELYPPKNLEAVPTMKDIGRNLIAIIRCPHCGLEHFLFIVKLKR